MRARHDNGRATVDAPVGYQLSPAEAGSLRDTAEGLVEAGAEPEKPSFFDGAQDLAQLLPPGLRHFLRTFRRERPACAALVSGILPGAVPATPPSWVEAVKLAPTTADIVLALCGAGLGEPFGWMTLQEGRLLQHVLPMPGDEFTQSGYGSVAFLEFHTEDAFHPQRPDHLLLLCLRNEDAIPTVLSSIRDVRLSAVSARILAQQRFAIVPDPEHVRQLSKLRPGHPAITRVRKMMEHPEPVSVIDQARPGGGIRFDRPFMQTFNADPAAQAALEELATQLEQVQQDVVIAPGSLLVIDNHLAVHGRRAFRARYDGTDRWLKKLLVSGELPGDEPSRSHESRRVLL